MGWCSVEQGRVLSVVWGGVELCKAVQCSVGLCFVGWYSVEQGRVFSLAKGSVSLLV